MSTLIRNRAEMEELKKAVIAVAKKLDPPSWGKISQLAKDFSIDRVTVRRILNSYTASTGYHFAFKSQKIHGDGVKYPFGFCLICKRASGNPVEEYAHGKHCFACNDTGYYLPEILGHNVESVS